MTANGSAGNRDGFEAWVAALQRPPGAGKTPSEPDIASALVDGNATQVQQIPKELIHRLRERETQGLLGVETERTAVFKPPPELLARAKRMQQVAKSSPSEAPAAERSDMPTAPPPEAAVPTVKPPPPSKVEAFDDDWSQLESGLDALKPIERPITAPRPSRPVAPAFTSAAPRPIISTTPRAVTSTAPRSAPSAAAPPLASVPAVPSLNAPASSSAPGSRTGAAVVVARTVAVVTGPDTSAAKSPETSATSAAPQPPAAPDFDMDEPTRIRADGFNALLGKPIQAPTEDLEVERSEPHVPAVTPHVQTLPEAFPAFRAETAAEPAVEAPVALPAYDSMSPGAIERGASGRRWVVIAAVFLSLVVIALAALRH